jgi:methylthioxylose transferase
MSRISHETWARIIGYCYVILAENLLMVLAMLPLLIMLLATDPRQTWPLIALVAPLCAPALVGARINEDGRLYLRWPPMYADWEPHWGPGTVPALVVAVLVICYGPAAAARLGWRPLLWAGGAASLAWTLSLALIDGWQRGVAGRLTTRHEYLRSVDDVWEPGLGEFLSTFTDRILLGQPDNWPAHVAGHPPGALLTFAGLDRIGLSGGGWAAWLVLLSAASVVPAVLIAVRALASAELARRAAPFLVLVPAAVWTGVSADAYFAAVAAWALALLAVAATGRTRAPWAAALGSGLLFGWLLYLSYGMVLMAFPAFAVLLLARNWRPLPWALLGIAAVTVAFTAGGFWWLEGYFTLHERYYQGAARLRPYGYFVWANLAVNVLTVGLAGVAALRRTAVALPGAARSMLPSAPPPTERAAAGHRLVLLLGAVALAALAANLSGMSKAETERIWLPFTLWLAAAAALLPGRTVRWWLAAQAALALAVNHLWLTGW